MVVDTCPLCTNTWEVSLNIFPDSSLLNILFHGMQAHPELDPVEYLDIIDRKLVTAPVDTDMLTYTY